MDATIGDKIKEQGEDSQLKCTVQQTYVRKLKQMLDQKPKRYKVNEVLLLSYRARMESGT